MGKGMKLGLAMVKVDLIQIYLKDGIGGCSGDLGSSVGFFFKLSVANSLSLAIYDTDTICPSLAIGVSALVDSPVSALRPSPLGPPPSTEVYEWDISSVSKLDTHGLDLYLKGVIVQPSCFGLICLCVEETNKSQFSIWNRILGDYAFLAQDERGCSCKHYNREAFACDGVAWRPGENGIKEWVMAVLKFEVNEDGGTSLMVPTYERNLYLVEVDDWDSSSVSKYNTHGLDLYMKGVIVQHSCDGLIFNMESNFG
ncbi:hypothetical protein L1049_021791 [Liquidambar formosana]|uniref:F-box protein n=1 Tax=Liquidambar formosana TaxID=63359 RepID=A0AAP0RBF4_LIQFO